MGAEAGYLLEHTPWLSWHSARTVATHALPTLLGTRPFSIPTSCYSLATPRSPSPGNLQFFSSCIPLLDHCCSCIACWECFIYVLTKWLVALLAHLKLPKLFQGDGLCLHILVCNQSPGEDWRGRASLCSLTIQHASRGSVALCWHQEMPADRVENLRCFHWQFPMLLLISPSAPLLMSTPIYEWWSGRHRYQKLTM